MIQEGRDGARAEQGAGHGSAGRGTEGGRGSAQGRKQGIGQGTHGKGRGQGHRQHTRASGSGGGEAHGAGESPGSGQRDTGHSAGQRQGHGKDAGGSSSARGRTQGHEQRAKASSSKAHGAGQGAGSGWRHNQGHGQGHGRDRAVSGTVKGAGDRAGYPRHGPEGKGEGVRLIRGPACWAPDHCCRAWLLPAPPLAWELGLRRWRAPRAVAPVGEGGAQGWGSQLLASASVTLSTAPPSRKNGPCWLLVGPAAQITARRTLSWSSRATHPPGGTSRFPSSLRRRTASKGQFINPLVVPEVAHLSHPYTFITRGRASPRRRSGIASQSRSQSPWAPSAPRAGSACSSCACCASAEPDSRAAGAGPRGAPLCGWGACL